MDPRGDYVHHMGWHAALHTLALGDAAGTLSRLESLSGPECDEFRHVVDNGTLLAFALGIPEGIVSLTLIALGTSLPELAATIASALKGHTEIALGNVIGSNLFNLLAIIGVASLVGPIPVGQQFLTFDLWVMLGASVLLAPFVFVKNLDLTRRWGALLTALGSAVFSITFKLAWPELPFIDRVGIVFLLCIAVGVIVSQLQGAPRHPKAVDYKNIDTHTTGGFNLAAFVVILMLVGLYATWW